MNGLGGLVNDFSGFARNADALRGQGPPSTIGTPPAVSENHLIRSFLGFSGGGGRNWRIGPESLLLR